MDRITELRSSMTETIEKMEGLLAKADEEKRELTDEEVTEYEAFESSYDKDKDEFYLICDNQDCPECGKVRLVGKEGDEFGIERIRERLDMDEEIIKRAFSLYGIPKILLRNSVPKEAALESFDNYEITPEYVYAWNKNKNEVEVKEKPWEITDDKGVVSFSLLPPPVVVSLIKQLADVLS